MAVTTTKLNDLQETELHEATAGLGNWHKVGNQNHYLANKEECLICLRDIEIALRESAAQQRHVHLKLGEWKVLPNHLLPLFTSYREDPEITDVLLKVLVQLTTHVDRRTSEVLRHLEYLQDYKEAFANRDAFIIVMGLLVSTMEVEEDEGATTTEEEKQQLKEKFEALLQLLRNLVSVPDPCAGDAGYTPLRKALQQTYIQHFHDEGALDFFILFSEQVDADNRPDQAWLFLDVVYHICAQVDPDQIVNTQRRKGRKGLSSLVEGEQIAKKIKRPDATRHSRFGTRMQTFNAVGGSSIAGSVMQISSVGKGRRVSGREFKDRQQSAQARKQNMFHDPFFVDLEEGIVRDHNQLNSHVRNGLDIARDYSDQVLDGLRKFFEEFVQTSFSSLVHMLRGSVTAARRQGTKAADTPGGEHGCYRMLNFVAWILEFHRAAHLAKVAEAAAKKTPGASAPVMDVSSVQGALDLDMIQFVTARLREYGKGENIHASYLVIVLRLLSQQVKTIAVALDASLSEVRDVGDILTQNIVKDDVMANLAWIMKNFKSTVHDPRVLSYSVELYHNLAKLMQRVAEKRGRGSDFQVEKARSDKVMRGITNADKEISRLNDAQVVENLFYLLEKYKRHTRDMHSMLTKLLYRIIEQQPTNIVVFFELSYFVRILRIVGDPLVKDMKFGKRYEEMTTLLRYILRQFFKCAETNSCLFVELLFRKVPENPKESLLENSNAEFAAILADYETDEYKQVFERLRQGATLDALKRKTVQDWTEAEDTVLRQRYAAYANHPLFLDLLVAELPLESRRNRDQVKRRLQDLNLVRVRGRGEDPAARANGPDGDGSPARKRQRLDEELREDPSANPPGEYDDEDLEKLLDEAWPEEDDDQNQAADQEGQAGPMATEPQAAAAAAAPAPAAASTVAATPSDGDFGMGPPEVGQREDDLELELEQLMDEAMMEEPFMDEMLSAAGGPAPDAGATAVDHSLD